MHQQNILSQRDLLQTLSIYLQKVPATRAQLEQAVTLAQEGTSELRHIPRQRLLDQMISLNIKQIEYLFLSMMQDVLASIEPQLKLYPQNRSIQYLEQVIYERLDPQVYSPEVRISKIRASTAKPAKQSEELSMIDMFFTELITVMNELLQHMKQHYGMPRDESVPPVLFQTLYSFVQANQNSFLVVQDLKAATNDPLLGVLEQVHKKTLKSKIKNTFSSKAKKMSSIEQQKQSKLKQIKSKVKREAVDQITAKTLQQFVDLGFHDLVGVMTSQEKQEFINVVIQALQHNKKEQRLSKISRINHIQNDVLKLLSSQEMDVESKSKMDYLQKHSKQLRWVVILYKLLEEQYYKDPERRKWLMRFCKQESICKALGNPFAIVKLLETHKCKQSEMLRHLRSLPLSESLKGFLLTQKRLDKEHLAIERQLNRIRLYDLNKKYDTEPKLVIQRLTNHKKRSITFFFSGFLSEQSCKVTEWIGLLNNFYDSQVYAVRWQSKSAVDLTKFIGRAVMDLKNPALLMGGPWVKALLTIHTVYDKLQENPFNPAFESAVMTGQYFAEFLMANFQGYFINLVGFSLGTEVISNIMTRMAAKEKLNMIHKVYLIGGVANRPTIQQIMQKSSTPLSIVNLYSQNDAILKYLLKLCKWGVQPVGMGEIKQIQGHEVRNQDCTSFIDGHLYYRENLDLIAKMLDMADD